MVSRFRECVAIVTYFRVFVGIDEVMLAIVTNFCVIMSRTG